MIKSFANRTAEDIYHGTNSRYARKLPTTLHDKARRLLDQINAAPDIHFLRIPPGNMLEKLSGDLKGCRSVRINNQWRIIFRWQGDDALACYH